MSYFINQNLENTLHLIEYAYGLVIHAWCEANEETADELEKIIDLFVKIGYTPKSMFLTHNSNNVKNKLLIAENLLLQAMPGVTSNEEEEILDSIVLQLEYRLMKLAEQKREA